MNLFYKLLFITILSSSVANSFAQIDTSHTKTDTSHILKDTSHINKDTAEKKETSARRKSYLKIGVNYINNSVYLGHTDTVSTPTITPTISYNLKCGLYFSGSLDYITNRKTNALDGGSIEAGYNYTIGDNLEGGVSFTKLFFNSTSTQVSASLSSIINANMAYDIAGIITPAISVNYSVVKGGSKNDIAWNPSLSHDFLIESIFGDKDLMLISPQVGLNAGSQNFYSEYLARKGQLKKGVTTALTNYSNSLGDFKLLDYEITAPIVYKAGHFMFSFTPTYAFAQNSLPQSTVGEKLIYDSIVKRSPYQSSIFYFETGISFKF